jgi:hypothetical protein
MGVVRAVRRVLLKAQAHLVVGIPQVLTHADTMTQVGNVGWPKAPPPQGFQFTRVWLHRQPDAPDLPDRARQWACEEIRRPSTRQHRAAARCHLPSPAGGRFDDDRTDRRAGASAIGPRRRPPDDDGRTGPCRGGHGYAPWRGVCRSHGSEPDRTGYG